MGQHKIFVLDDERDVGEYIAAVASMNDFDSRYFSDGEDFFSAVAATPSSCVVVDLQMPGLDGIEVLRRLAGLHFQRPIIIMSGMGLKVLEAARHFAGANGLAVSDILSKPVRVEELGRVFERLKQNARMPPSKAGLAAAMAQGEFSLHLQPKVSIAAPANGRKGCAPVGFEGLLRWNSPTRGLVMPNEFIPQIAEAGLGPQLSDLVFDLALNTLRRWQEAGIDANLAINMSAADVEDISLADRLWSRCSTSGVNQQRITIEITETAAMTHPETALDVLTRLRLRGFFLSLDDFGTGYSSLVQLQRLPFAELKIDRTLISDCTASVQTRIIVKAIVELGHNLGLNVTAEGVEDEETLAFLRACACDLVQGYLFARPMACEQAEAWWRDNVCGCAH